jgi:hypothetical protein
MDGLNYPGGRLNLSELVVSCLIWIRPAWQDFILLRFISFTLYFKSKQRIAEFYRPIKCCQ